MEIKRIVGNTAIAEAMGVETSVNILLSPDVQVGDKVLIHAGFIIEKLDPEAAIEIEKIWEEYLQSENPSNAKLQ